LAEAIQEAYGDLFAVNLKANELSVAEVKNKLRTLTQGKNSDNVIALMANTFKALVDYAEWLPEAQKKTPKKEDDAKKAQGAPASPTAEKPAEGDGQEQEEDASVKVRKTQLHYNIQIHLPESRDQAVYDAIFKSLRKHLF